MSSKFRGFASVVLTVIVSAFATNADAQDRYNWSGLYIGAGVGYRSTDVNWNFFSAPPGSTASTSQSFDTVSLSGHLGYQQQFGSLILGAEVGKSGDTPNERHSSSCAFPAPFQDRCDYNRMRAVNLVGVRLGYTPIERWMLFASAGYAQANINTSMRFGTAAAPPAPNAIPLSSGISEHDGWYVGGGVEYALTQNFILGVDYKHIDLGNGRICGTPGECVGPSAILSFNRDISAEIDLVEARISFKFGN